MTLALSLANRHVTIQLSDRRVTAIGSPKGRPVPGGQQENANKAGALICADARMAFAFTGLVWSAKFNTQKWIRKSLLAAAAPKYDIEHIVQQMCSRATEEFTSNPAILQVEPRKRKLSLMLTGFWNTTAGQLPAGWIITNFQRNFDLGGGAPDSEEAWDRFRIWRWHQDAPPTSHFCHVERLGRWPSVSNAEMADLRALLIEERPIKAIIGRAVHVFRCASGRPRAGGTVGQDISVVTVPFDCGEPITFSAEAGRPTDDVYVPDMLVATDSRHCHWVELGVRHIPTPESSGPALVPRVRPGRPCPCGSGQKYGRCHGQAAKQRTHRRG